MKFYLLLSLSICTTLYAGAQTRVWKSLNGYTLQESKDMIKPFNPTGRQKPLVTCVWFDRTTILNMVTLLNTEAKKGRHTDGIRIYFAKVGNNYTVVIVSTYDTATHNPMSPEQDSFHDDYWDHDSTDLFKMNPSVLHGEPCYGTDNCKTQALLYQNLNNSDTCKWYADNPHYLSQADCRNMVYAFTQQKTNINTKGEWFDLKLLNAFADLLKKTNNTDGVRIYFAKHVSQNDTQYPDYYDQNAFVIVPTQTIPNSNPVISKQDLFDCSMANYDPSASVTRLKMHIKKRPGHAPDTTYSRFKFRYQHFVRANGGGGQDNGELCPTNCD